MDIGILEIKTHGVCFLCLRKREEKAQGDRAAFKIFLRYLQVHLWRVTCVAKKCEEVNVSLCEECSSIVNQFWEIYQDFETARLLLEQCTQMIVDVIDAREKNDDIDDVVIRKFESQLKFESGEVKILSDEVAQKLRIMTLEKCLLKRKNSLPRVNLKNENNLCKTRPPSAVMTTPYASFDVIDDGNDYSNISSSMIVRDVPTEESQPTPIITIEDDDVKIQKNPPVNILATHFNEPEPYPQAFTCPEYEYDYDYSVDPLQVVTLMDSSSSITSTSVRTPLPVVPSLPSASSFEVTTPYNSFSIPYLSKNYINHRQQPKSRSQQSQPHHPLPLSTNDDSKTCHFCGLTSFSEFVNLRHLKTSHTFETYLRLLPDATTNSDFNNAFEREINKHQRHRPASNQGALLHMCNYCGKHCGFLMFFKEHILDCHFDKLLQELQNYSTYSNLRNH